MYFATFLKEGFTIYFHNFEIDQNVAYFEDFQENIELQLYSDEVGL